MVDHCIQDLMSQMSCLSLRAMAVLTSSVSPVWVSQQDSAAYSATSTPKMWIDCMLPTHMYCKKEGDQVFWHLSTHADQISNREGNSTSRPPTKG